MCMPVARRSTQPPAAQNCHIWQEGQWGAEVRVQLPSLDPDLIMDHKGTFSRRSGDEEDTPSSTGKAPYLPPGCVVCGKETKSRCTACWLVRYCSKECQKQHWPVHKQTCPWANRKPPKESRM